MMTEYLPLEEIDINRFTVYKRELLPNKYGMIGVQEFNLYLSEEPNRYHKYQGFNKITRESFPLPTDEWENTNSIEYLTKEYQKKLQQHIEEFGNIEEVYKKFSHLKSLDEYLEYTRLNFLKKVHKFVFDPTAMVFNPEAVKNYRQKYIDSGYIEYQTLDNRLTGYIVYVNPEGNHVVIFGRTDDVITADTTTRKDYPISTFTKKIGEYYPKEIFIGKSPFNEMTEFSGGYGDRFDGNSILLDLTSEDYTILHKYLFIGHQIYQFITDEKITKYTSSVGNNCVPYPYAESENYVYSMLEKNYSNIKYHSQRQKSGCIDYLKSPVEYNNFEYTIVDKRNICSERQEASVVDYLDKSSENETAKYYYSTESMKVSILGNLSNQEQPQEESIFTNIYNRIRSYLFF